MLKDKVGTVSANLLPSESLYYNLLIGSLKAESGNKMMHLKLQYTGITTEILEWLKNQHLNQ